METVPVKRYLRRRLTKQQRLKGMIAAAKSRRTPARLRKGLRLHLRKEGIQI